MVESTVMTSGWVVSCVVVLWAASDPAQPWVIAGTLAATGVLAMVLGDAVAAVWDRHTLRTLRSTAKDDTVQDAIADLRTQVSAITRVLEVHSNDAHLKAGQQIEYALARLDAVEQELSETRN
jgi:hypothetical protein